MLFLALAPLADEFILFNLFRYLTFRSGGACMTALFLSFALGGTVIRRLRQLQAEGQPMREQYMTASHLLGKRGTPTMGGVLILIALLSSSLLWVDLRNGYVWAVLVVTVGYGLLGFADDFLKVTRRNTKGVPAWTKLAVQSGLGALAALWIMAIARPPLEAALAVPFFKDVLIQLGWFFVPFGALVMIGTSNAVNLTDGLDGLAIVPVMIAAAVFALIAYLTGNAVFANYLQLHFVPGAGELAVVCAALIGAGMGFLWFNAPPAMVFMGDTGSLSLGGALGAIAVATKHEIVLMIVGGLFVLETASVIVQVVSYKLTGKRVFRMAPLHHHFEKKGWAESTIVIRFWIIAMILALIGLSTLKLR
jgi:phospho-N-acetylmuramoyl-pentapeptide-transferase